MKKFSKVLVLSFIISLVGCSSDDDDEPTISVNDFTVTVDENQSTGIDLGSIGATGTDGAITYSIASQTPNGALAINATTGSLTVADETTFDFEANTNITANITVTGSTVTETVTATITLNDIDDIEFFLSDSKSDYTAAAVGDWIVVTEAEYNNLVLKLNNVSKVGTSESLYGANFHMSGSHKFTIINNAEAEVPANSYVFAFKYHIKGDDVEGLKVKQSKTINDSYSDLGNPLPKHSGSGVDVCFVLKGNDAKLDAQGYIGFYKPAEVKMGLSISMNTYFYSGGDVNTDFSEYNGYLHYQGLSTTQKQW